MDNEIFKVFLLEDQPLDMEINKRQVRKYRSDVLFATARNRSEFEAKLVDFQPDIVLSDYNLPDMNGLDALLYAREHLDAVPFVFITGILNDEERVADAILNGASGYLLKENIKKLPELLESVVAENREVMRRRERQWEERKDSHLSLQRTIAALRHSGLGNADELIADLSRVADRLS